jgi:hypothetical protein
VLLGQKVEDGIVEETDAFVDVCVGHVEGITSDGFFPLRKGLPSGWFGAFIRATQTLTAQRRMLIALGEQSATTETMLSLVHPQCSP